MLNGLKASFLIEHPTCCGVFAVNTYAHVHMSPSISLRVGSGINLDSRHFALPSVPCRVTAEDHAIGRCLLHKVFVNGDRGGSADSVAFWQVDLCAYQCLAHPCCQPLYTV